jgi:hypothetical protein
LFGVFGFEIIVLGFRILVKGKLLKSVCRVLLDLDWQRFSEQFVRIESLLINKDESSFELNFVKRYHRGLFSRQKIPNSATGLDIGIILPINNT